MSNAKKNCELIMKLMGTDMRYLRLVKSEPVRRPYNPISKDDKENRLFWLNYHISTNPVDATISNVTVRIGYQLLKSNDNPKSWMYISWRGHVSDFSDYGTVRHWMKQEIEHNGD